MTQSYIGTKIVLALAMSREAYNEYRGWKLPADEDGADAGYLVEYQDGGKPNHPDHVGYISWSPKDQFEAAYIPMGNIGHLLPFGQRVIGEHAQLLDKVTKLRGFVDSSAFMALTGTERDHLTEQLAAMEAYLAALNKRIAAFPFPNGAKAFP